jgi:hypothetical protein
MPVVRKDFGHFCLSWRYHFRTKHLYGNLCLVIIQNALETVRAQGRPTLKMMAGCVVSGT